MKKAIILLFALLFHASLIFAQEDGFGFYFGYQLGKYTPGLGNISATTQLYNNRYDADFDFNNNCNGITYGIKAVGKKYYQMDIQIVRRKTVMQSTFTNLDTDELWKMGMKIKYNTLVWGHALHISPFAVGVSFPFLGQCLIIIYQRYFFSLNGSTPIKGKIAKFYWAQSS